MPYGAGTVAARRAGATGLVDPRPHAVGSIADTLRTYPHIGLVLPAMGYGWRQIEELAATIDAADCDVVVAGTPIDLRRLLGTGPPVRQARYELRELGHPDLADVLGPILAAARPARQVAAAP
jgi:predicted GTPase